MSVYLFKTAIRHRVSPEFIGSRYCHCQESAGTGPVNLKVVPNECYQLICASLSHTHFWYEVGMLKSSAGCENFINHSINHVRVWLRPDRLMSRTYTHIDTHKKCKRDQALLFRTRQLGFFFIYIYIYAQQVEND